MGHLTLAAQEGGSLDFWDTERGDSKPRRRRESLKNFSLISATFRGIWHWRVSAIFLSGPMSPPRSCPSCHLPPWLQGEAAHPHPHHARALPRDARAGLPQDSLFPHSFVQPFTYSLIHWASVFYSYCPPGPILGVWGANTRKVWSKHFREIFAQSMSSQHSHR